MISFLIIVISCYESLIVISLDFFLLNLFKVSSRLIFAFIFLSFSSLIGVFLSFLRYSSFSSGLSIWLIKFISKFCCSSHLVKTLIVLCHLERTLIVLQQVSTTNFNIRGIRRLTVRVIARIS